MDRGLDDRHREVSSKNMERLNPDYLLAQYQIRYLSGGGERGNSASPSGHGVVVLKHFP